MNESTQVRIGRWVRKTFGDRVLFDRRERALRVLEEAAELAQAEGVPMGQVEQVFRRAYSRPKGRPQQEAAGVAITLLAWGEAAGESLSKAIQQELKRIDSPEIMLRCRLKQNEKAALGLALPSEYT